MNYISKDIIKILVQEVYEKKGTTEVDLSEIHETIREKFGNSLLPEDFDKLIDENIAELKDYDVSNKHVIVFSESPFVLCQESKPFDVKLEDDNWMDEDDDLKEIDRLLKKKERVVKRERSIVRRKSRPKRSSEEDSDSFNRRYDRQIGFQEQNRYIREAQKQESEGMRLLREYAIACNLRNRTLRGLYKIRDPEKREKELVRLLRQRGERWKDTYPTEEEIQLAKQSAAQDGDKQKEPRFRKVRTRKVKLTLYSQNPNSDYSE